MRRFLLIVLRLSIVVGIGAGVWDAARIYGEHVASKAGDERIGRGLECAAKMTDEVLRQTANRFGLYDISKVGCSVDTLLASAAEIAAVREVGYVSMALSAYDIGSVYAGFFAMVVTNLIGLLVAGAWMLGRWVLGA